MHRPIANLHPFFGQIDALLRKSIHKWQICIHFLGNASTNGKRESIFWKNGFIFEKVNREMAILDPFSGKSIQLLKMCIHK
jgi:hypothetical protein